MFKFCIIWSSSNFAITLTWRRITEAQDVPSYIRNSTRDTVHNIRVLLFVWYPHKFLRPVVPITSMIHVSQGRYYCSDVAVFQSVSSFLFQNIPARLHFGFNQVTWYYLASVLFFLILYPVCSQRLCWADINIALYLHTLTLYSCRNENFVQAVQLIHIILSTDAKCYWYHYYHKYS
jgi:hypothetical protein